MTVGVKALGNGGDFTLKTTANPKFMREVEVGLALLREEFNNNSEARRVVKEEKDEVLDNPHFFSSNQAYCGAWVEQAKAMEIYKIMRAAKGHTVSSLCRLWKM